VEGMLLVEKDKRRLSESGRRGEGGKGEELAVVRR